MLLLVRRCRRRLAVGISLLRESLPYHDTYTMVGGDVVATTASVSNDDDDGEILPEEEVVNSWSRKR